MAKNTKSKILDRSVGHPASLRMLPLRSLTDVRFLKSLYVSKYMVNLNFIFQL